MASGTHKVQTLVRRSGTVRSRDLVSAGATRTQLSRMVAAGELMPAALTLAEVICKNGPLAVRTAKEIAVRSLGLESGFVLEKALGARVFSSEDAKEGPRAFAEKRPPRFTGR